MEHTLPGSSFRFTEANDLNDPFEYKKIFRELLHPEAMSTEHRKNPEVGIDEALQKIESDPQLALLFSLFPESQKRNFLASLQSILLGVIEQPTISFLNDSLKSTLSQAIEYASSQLGILSLTENEADLLMWSHYADSHKGFLIEIDTSNSYFDISDGKESLRRIRKVHYTKNRPPLDIRRTDVKWEWDDFYTGMFFTKSMEWEYEREWRMAIARSDAGNPDGLILREFPPEIITRIVVGCEAEEETVAALFGALRERPELDHVVIEKAHVHTEQFGVEYRPLSNVSATDVKKILTNAFPDLRACSAADYADVQSDLQSLHIPTARRIEQILTDLAPRVIKLFHWLKTGSTDLALDRCDAAQIAFLLQYGATWFGTLPQKEDPIQDHLSEFQHSLEESIAPERENILAAVTRLIKEAGLDNIPEFELPPTVDDDFYPSIEIPEYKRLTPNILNQLYAETETVLEKAQHFAAGSCHLFVNSFDILDALIEESEECRAIIESRCALEKVSAACDVFIRNNGSPDLFGGAFNRPLSLEAESVLVEASRIAALQGSDEIYPTHLLHGICSEWSMVGPILWSFDLHSDNIDDLPESQEGS